MTDKSLEKRNEKQTTPARQSETTKATYVPRVDILESESEVTLIADMPGIDEKSVDIDLDQNVLTIKGHYVLETPDGFTRTYAEYESGNYERTFTLGDTIDREAIEATVKDGVLRLTLPKAKEAQARKIPVSVG